MINDPQYDPVANVPWHEITQHINEKYQVLDVFSLDHYYFQMDKLYQRLLPFQSKKFNSNEKLVCYFFDTEFFIGNTGFNIYNFQLILKNLNIAQSAVLFLTTHYGIEQEIHRLGQYLCNDEWPMQVLPNSYVQIISNPEPDILDTSQVDKIEYPYVFLNGVQRSHRIMLLSILDERNLIDQGIVTWNFSNNRKNKASSDDQKTKTSIANIDHQAMPKQPFLITFPISRVNDVVNWNSRLHSAFDTHSHRFDCQTGSTISISTYDTNCSIEDHFLKSFLTVVAETVFNYPYCFITEKTFKTFLNRRPFVVAGAPGTLQRLHQLGFKTFDTIFDETYDNESDPSIRLLKVAEIINFVSNLSISDIKQLMIDIEPILEYNYYHYHQNYCKKDLKTFISLL